MEAYNSCLQRHGISILPEVTGDKEPKRKFKTYPIGYFHVDIAEVQTAEGKLRLFVVFDWTSKFVFVELHQKAGKMIAAQFLGNLVAAVSNRIHTVLTDNGIQFTNMAHHTRAVHIFLESRKHVKLALNQRARRATRFHRNRTRSSAFEHIFDRVCDENDIEHRLTKIKHPWTNGQVERMIRTIKEVTVKRYHYESHDQFKTHLRDFIDAYNYGRRLKTLKGLTPFEFICKCWTNESERFNLNPYHQKLGSNTYSAFGPHYFRKCFFR